MTEHELNRRVRMIIQAAQAGFISQEQAQDECTKVVQEWEATNKKNKEKK